MKINRRDTVKYGALTAAACVIAGLGNKAAGVFKKEFKGIRPPGALKEDEFLRLCIKCGQCVQVCPYHAVSLKDLDSGADIGTPAIYPDKRGCYLCDLLPCVLACPSGALDHNVSDAKDVKMSDISVVDKDACYGMKGMEFTEDDLAEILSHGIKSPVEYELAEKLRSDTGKPCRICRDYCPYPEKDGAIVLKESSDGGYYPEIRDKCAGCGVCIELCPSKKVFSYKKI